MVIIEEIEQALEKISMNFTIYNIHDSIIIIH